jgi:hypothetical protein
MLTMEKSLGRYLSQYFHMPHLYRDDLEAIERIVMEELRPESYHVALAGFRHKGVSEIPKELETVNTFVFYAHNPSFRLKLARSWAELYSDVEDPNAQASLKKILEIVKKNERPGLWLLCRKAPWLAPLLGFGMVAIITGCVNVGFLRPGAMAIAPVVLLIGAIWWAVGHYYTAFGFSRVTLHENRPK